LAVDHRTKRQQKAFQPTGFATHQRYGGLDRIPMYATKWESSSAPLCLKTLQRSRAYSQEVNPSKIQSRHSTLEVNSVPLRERWFVIGKQRNARPDLIIGRSQDTVRAICQLMFRVRPSSANHCAHRKILKISSISESPGNKGCLMAISAKIHPTDHMSMAVL
jgi:hypothetical protein